MFLLMTTLTAMAQDQATDTMVPDLAGIIVKDIDAVTTWYETNLGFTVYKKMDLPQYDSLKINFLKRDGFNLELVGRRRTIDRNEYSSFENPQLTGLNKISFRVQNIQSLADRLRKNGVRFKTNVFHDANFKLTSFIVEDPEGNIVQFVEYDR